MKKSRSRKTLFVLILVGLLIGGLGCDDVCSDKHETRLDAGSNSNTDSDSDTDSGDDTGEDSNGQCHGEDFWYCEPDEEVNTPVPGTPAELESICAESGVVYSNTSAHVTLNRYSASSNLATGAIEIAHEIQGAIIGEPHIDIIEATPAELYQLKVRELSPSTTGYTFHASWPTSYLGGGNMVVRVTLEIDCSNVEGLDAGSASDGGQSTRTVEAISFFEWCEHPDELESTKESWWVTSGEMCYYCICTSEMAPTPIPRDAEADGLALPRSFGLEIEKIAMFDRTLVLLAEHPDSRGTVDYHWEVSAGTIDEYDQGGIVWELPETPGPHLIQVAVRDENSAAVAALTWGTR
ncbi:MAG: hypothetical protein GY847_24265 [Proteobacteria bacterium]|nr:hypothetical protein [Pseudomonadota bacterium]